MTPTEEFIENLEKLQSGARSLLRSLAGQPLHANLPGFDLFTGLWWPLREQSPQAPRREPSWLVAKLHAAFPVPYVRLERAPETKLVAVVGRCEPGDTQARRRFRDRFDALLCSPLSGLEPHLRWSLAVVADAREKGRCPGLDWAQLLDDLSIWERGEAHQRRRDIRDIWAEEYLNAVNRAKEERENAH